MPFYFDIDPDLDLLYVVTEGDVNAGQLARHVAAFPADPAFHPGIDTLFDVRADTQIDLENEAMEALTEAVYAARQGQAYRVGGVVRTQEHETFFQAAVAILNPEAEAHAFYGYAKALDWLGHRPAKTRVLQQMRADRKAQRSPGEGDPRGEAQAVSVRPEGEEL